MKNLTCKTCASNNFREEEKHYVCTYCNTIILKKYSVEKKRIVLISSVLFVITVGLFLAYVLLFDVKEDITVLSKQNTDISSSNNQINHYDETNPFSDMILKVEKKVGSNIENNALEEALLKYFIQEENKAFYVVLTSDGKYAFGMSRAETSTMIAEKEAKKACNEAKTSKNIKGECIPYAINSHVSQFLINN